VGSAEQLSHGRRVARRDAPARRPAVVWRLVVSGVCRSVLLVALALTAWAVLPVVVGSKPTVVMSGSMSPVLPVGDVVVSRPVDRADLALGQVLLFDDPDRPGTLRMHRLVDARGDVLRTKGDANADRDSSPIPFDAVHGVGYLRVPFIGLPALWLRSGQVVPFAAVCAGALLLIAGTQLDRPLLGGRHVGPRLPGRHVGSRVAALGLVAAVTLTGLQAPLQPADARFASATKNGPSSLTACVDFPVRSSWQAAASIYLNYMEQSGTSTVNRAAADAGWSLTNVARGSGTCVRNGSPYVSLGAGAAAGQNAPSLIVARGAVAEPGAVTVATWFRTSMNRAGMIANLGTGSTLATSSTVDRALYIDDGGRLVFAGTTVNLVGGSLGKTSCSTAGGYNDGSWHLVMASFDSAGTCRIGVDGVLPVANTSSWTTTGLTLQVVGTSTWYCRIGYDNLFGYSGTSGLPPTSFFVGDLDETQMYTTALASSRQTDLVAIGH
jgi:signal peptidase I